MSGLGFFASAYDSQMTIYRAFRNLRKRTGSCGGGGQARENSAASGSRVRDSRLQNNGLTAMRYVAGAGTKSPAGVQNAIIAPMRAFFEHRRPKYSATQAITLAQAPNCSLNSDADGS